MNIAVEEGAEADKTFAHYVDFLAAKGFVPNGKPWVDHIRKVGNIAAHQIELMSAQQSSELITFVEMLLRFIYEFPNRVPKLAAG